MVKKKIVYKMIAHTRNQEKNATSDNEAIIKLSEHHYIRKSATMKNFPVNTNHQDGFKWTNVSKDQNLQKEFLKIVKTLS